MKRFWRQFRAFGLAALALAAALLLPLQPSHAQAVQPAQPAPAATPVQLSDEQLNQIVRAVTGAVLTDLKAAQPTPAVQPPAASPPPSPTEGLTAYLQEKQEEFISKLSITVGAFPALGEQVSSILERVDGGARGHSTPVFFGLMALILAAAAAVAYAVTAVARRLLPGTEPKGGTASVSQTLRRAVANLIGLVAFWAVTAYVSEQYAHGMGMQGMVAQLIMTMGAQIALFYTLFLIWFRPRDPAFRMVPLDGPDARLVMNMFLTVMSVVVLRYWISIPIANHQPTTMISAGLLVNNLMFVSSFFVGALPARAAVRRWIEATTLSSSVSPLRRWFGRNWMVIAGCCVLTISALNAYGAVIGKPSVIAGLTTTVRVAVAMILLCALAEFVGRRSELADQASKRAIPKLPGLVSKMLRVLILVGTLIYFVRLWAVEALQVMTHEEWSRLADFFIAPLAALFIGYLAVSYVNYLAARYLATHPTAATTMDENGNVVSNPDGASRLRTLIPIIRISTNTLIVVMMVLLVLSQFGFNITPLLAGASVIGLAISFGSQALVKDIVTGVLFLAEDSFRIGESIVCGNASGTVEGFTLRSVRLRHPDGQIFTVPFGQIGEIVNFSRDWSTVKFKMGLDRDVDLDEVRRATAKVAESLKTDFRDRLLDSLKVQGVQDVTDTAMVVQFMFTALPRDPAEIERAARSRLLTAFKEDGIALSRNPWAARAAVAAAATA